MKKAGTITLNIVYTAVVLAVLSLAVLFVGTKVHMFGYQVKIVESGSMEPAIMTGGIVVIAPSDTYNVGDIITFGRDTKSHVPTTHRIIDKSGEGKDITFRTKGDANKDPDPNLTTQNQVIGKVAFTIPYIGYTIAFARTPLGFVLFIGIPALLIVLDEIANIVWEIKVFFAKKRKLQYRTRTKRAPREAKRVAASEAAGSALLSELPQMKDKHTRTRFDLIVKPQKRRII